MTQIRSLVLYHAELLTVGGAERLLLEEYRFFKGKGFRVKLLTCVVRERALFDHVVDELHVLGNNWGTVPLLHMLWRVVMLRRWLCQTRPDAVICTSGPSGDHLEMYFATLLTSIPYLLHIHGSLFWFDNDLMKYALIHRVVFKTIRESVRGHTEFISQEPRCSLVSRIMLEFRAVLDYLAVKKARAIVVLTSQVQWEVKNLYRRTAVVSRGCLNPRIFDHVPTRDMRKKLLIGDHTKLVLSVSRLDRRKRCDILIHAFAKLIQKRQSDVVLLIVGEGPDEGRLRSLAEQLDLSGEVKFTGFLKEDELWDCYDTCDVFACPGWISSPITAYEALALNRKVVWSSEACEPWQVLNNPLVFLADPDPESLVDALEMALRTDVKTRVDLREFTWDNYFTTVYRVLVDSVDPLQMAGDVS